MVNWDANELRVTFEAAGLVVEVITERTLTQKYITPALIERRLAPTAATTKHLARFLTAAVRTVQDLFNRSLVHQTVTWSSTIALCKQHH